MEILRKQNEFMSKKVQDLTTENRKLQEPLTKALNDTNKFKQQLEYYQKDKLSLAVNTYFFYSRFSFISWSRVTYQIKVLTLFRTRNRYWHRRRRNC